jgi:hypothetical protein
MVGKEEQGAGDPDGTQHQDQRPQSAETNDAKIYSYSEKEMPSYLFTQMRLYLKASNYCVHIIIYTIIHIQGDL